MKLTGRFTTDFKEQARRTLEPLKSVTEPLNNETVPEGKVGIEKDRINDLLDLLDTSQETLNSMSEAERSQIKATLKSMTSKEVKIIFLQEAKPKDLYISTISRRKADYLRITGETLSL